MAHRNGIDMVSRIIRIQAVFHTSEGDVVSTTPLAFDNYKTEYITSAGIAFLTGLDVVDVWSILNSHALKMHDVEGVKWVSLKDAMLVISLLMP